MRSPFRSKAKTSRGLGKAVTETETFEGLDTLEHSDDDLGDSVKAELSSDEEAVSSPEAKSVVDSIIEAEENKRKPTRRFGKPSISKEPKAPKAAKEPKAKKVKGASKKSKEKSEKDEEAERDLAIRLSSRVMIEEQPGITKEDAITSAQHWARNHFDNVSNCYYYVHEIRGGWIIEVQEGVGRAYLPSIVDLAQKHPGRLIVVPMVRRKLTVHYSARNDSFEAQILGEGVEPKGVGDMEPMMAKRGPVMTPVMKQHQQWMITGMITAGIGALALLSSIAFYALDPAAKVPPEWRTTDITQLPVMQWPRLQAQSDDSYVVRLEFVDNQWRVVRQAVTAQVEVSDVGTDASGGPIVGGVVEGPAQPDVIGQPAAPSGATPTTTVPGGIPAIPPQQ